MKPQEISNIEEKEIDIAINETEKNNPTTFEYNQYKENLLNIFNLTTKENSILIDFNINGDKVKNEVKKIEQNGYQEQLKDQGFSYNESFKVGVLEPFLISFTKNNHNKIVITDIMESEITDKVNYRIITENNDMITVNGIDRDYANFIAEEVAKIAYDNSTQSIKNPVLVKEIDEQGKSNTKVIILIIVLLGLTLIGTIFFTVVANK